MTDRASSNDVEILIVGGGIAGASLGAEIAADANVLLVEAERDCGYHSTGRSAAFWLESYGGPVVAPLSAASHNFLADPPPDFAEHGFLRQRGAVHLSMDDWPQLDATVEVRRLGPDELGEMVPGVRPQWRFGLHEPGCADIDVGALHAAYLRALRRAGGRVATGAALRSATRRNERWLVELSDGACLTASAIVDAAGAWADEVAAACDVEPLGIAPKRRTMVQLRVGRGGLRDLPLVNDASGTFYFKGEGDRTIWLSPHDEIATDPCDAAPEEIDIATAIDRFGTVVDWPIEAVERKWAGLRSFAPDRIPVYGFDPGATGFFWCAGLGGFGIQTAPAAARLAAALLLGRAPDSSIAHIDPAAFAPRRTD